MGSSGLGARTVTATKWSLITQLASKLISPLTTIALARILAPEAIGVVSLVTMVTSFADLFSDAGFQKYLIQHEYCDERELGLSADVAFWTNLAVSLLLWGGVVLLRDQVASMVGNSSIGPAVSIACGSLPLTAAISVQTAVYQRVLDFRTLFYSRVGSALLVFLVSVPFAFFGAGYWSMIAGTLVSNLFLAVWLTLKSEWKPSLQYSFVELRAMFSFSWWTLLESFSVWLTSWAGTFILSHAMTGYYLGLYNTSTSLVNSAIGVVTSSVSPVVFSSLSRLQRNRPAFNSAFYAMQKAMAMCIVPIAAALFVFSDLIVDIVLGPQWHETSTFFGLYALASALVVVFCHTASAAYRALGRPKLSLIAQVGFLFVMVPSLYIGANMGYFSFSVLVPVARVLGFVSVHFVICHVFAGLSPIRMLYSLRWVYIATIALLVPAFILVKMLDVDSLMQVVLLIFLMSLYIVELLRIRDLREDFIGLLDSFGLVSVFKRVIPNRISKLIAMQITESSDAKGNQSECNNDT